LLFTRDLGLRDEGLVNCGRFSILEDAPLAAQTIGKVDITYRIRFFTSVLEIADAPSFGGFASWEGNNAMTAAEPFGTLPVPHTGNIPDTEVDLAGETGATRILNFYRNGIYLMCANCTGSTIVGGATFGALPTKNAPGTATITDLSGTYLSSFAAYQPIDQTGATSIVQRMRIFSVRIDKPGGYAHSAMHTLTSATSVLTAQVMVIRLPAMQPIFNPSKRIASLASELLKLQHDMKRKDNALEEKEPSRLFDRRDKNTNSVLDVESSPSFTTQRAVEIRPQQRQDEIELATPARTPSRERSFVSQSGDRWAMISPPTLQQRQ